MLAGEVDCGLIPPGIGDTRVPASTATVTEVVNDKTSTITRQELDGASAAAPARPQSKRTPWGL
jgi:hypothetical protein